MIEKLRSEAAPQVWMAWLSAQSLTVLNPDFTGAIQKSEQLSQFLKDFSKDHIVGWLSALLGQNH